VLLAHSPQQVADYSSSGDGTFFPNNFTNNDSLTHVSKDSISFQKISLSPHRL
jgi:hypothetical protein